MILESCTKMADANIAEGACIAFGAVLIFGFGCGEMLGKLQAMLILYFSQKYWCSNFIPGSLTKTF